MKVLVSERSDVEVESGGLSEADDEWGEQGENEGEEGKEGEVDEEEEEKEEEEGEEEEEEEEEEEHKEVLTTSGGECVNELNFLLT
jgi:hypothetical protein